MSSLCCALQQAQQAALDEADGVLAAIPPGLSGPELSFLQRYKNIANFIFKETKTQSQQEPQQEDIEDFSPGPHARLAGALAVEMLAPCENPRKPVDANGVHLPPPPPRSWGHLLRLALPALRATTADVQMNSSSGGESDAAVTITAGQVHALLAKLQALVASEHRVGSKGGASDRRSTLPSAPPLYRFGGGGDDGDDVVREVRVALAQCLGATMVVQNSKEMRAPTTSRGQARRTARGSKRLPAEALIAPRVAVWP